MNKKIVSPCISICKTDPKTGYCYGCGRNNDEKKIWKLEDTTDDWKKENIEIIKKRLNGCLLYTSPSPRDRTRSRMPSSA